MRDMESAFTTVLRRGLCWIACGLATAAAMAQTQAVSPAATPEPVPAQGAVSADYVIGPGDTLQVFVWRNPDLTTTVPVRPDGKISTPLVEDMPAIGKTSSALARDIETVLAEYVRSPQVNVIVTQPLSASSQVKIIGEVVNPRAIAYQQDMTVLDVVLTAGGLTPYASANRARVVRKEGGRQREIRVRLGDLLNGEDMDQDIPLQPGDVLVVPASRF
jgi:polysaccharide export outer membrane protein